MIKFKVADIWNDFYKPKNLKKHADPIFHFFSTSASKSACFSGYREEKFSFDFNSKNPKYRNFENALRRVIINAINTGFSTFYCGMCYGFDILAGEIVLEQKANSKNVKLIAVVPFEDQAKTFTESWRNRYFKLIDSADKVVMLQPHYRNGCYERRNQYMANRCSLLICYYIGGSGGTKKTLVYSQAKGLDIINIKDFLD